MRHLALLAAIYALIAALVLPGTLLAQESEEPPSTETTAIEQAAPAPAPEPAPAAEPAPAPPEPEPEVLADQRDDAPKPEPKRKRTAVAAASGSVTIVDFNFSPGTITINVGDTVTWSNDGPTPHSATSSNGAFDTGIFPAGQSRSHTFNEAGTFSYICTPHPNMRGTVVVQGAQTGGGDTPDSSGGSDDSAGTGATGEAAQSEGPTLPNSGADSGALLILGGLLLLFGVAVHRRVRPE